MKEQQHNNVALIDTINCKFDFQKLKIDESFDMHGAGQI